MVNLPICFHVACVALLFWFLSNKGGRGLKNREEIGAFLSRSVCQRTDRSDWFRMLARQSNILEIPLPWESFERLNKSSRQNKIKIWQKH